MTTVHIWRAAHLRLVEAERKLQALMKYGVENWDGYGDATSAFLEEGIAAAEAAEPEHNTQQGDTDV